MAIRIRRREFVTLLGGGASWPLAARAQQSGKLPTIGYLGATTPSAGGRLLAVFVARLRELGWLDGRTVAIEYRWAKGHNELLAKFAAEFVRRKVNVIVAGATPPTIAAKQATSTIPIVFAAAGDPVGTGLVASLARPSGNVTGLSLQQSDIAGKRLELLREVVPGLRRLAIMGNSNNPAALSDMRDAQVAASTIGLDTVAAEIRRPEDIALVFDMLKGNAGAIYVCNDPLVATNRVRLSTLAAGLHLPTMHGAREHVVVGGLMSYSANYADLFRRAADLVDKILRGAKPGDIPVEQPTKFDLIINLTTAKALGLAVPDKLLAIADEVIE
jgi:putative ABC transport system substrate-binding protein